MGEQQAEFTPSIGVIGCGSLGTAILCGLLSAKEPKVKPSKVLASVASEPSASGLRDSIRDLSPPIEVFCGQNERVVRESDVVVLAFPPDKVSEVLGGAEIQDSLSGKLLISVLAGVTTHKIKEALGNQPCWVVRALPNLAVAQHASTTAVEEFDEKMPVEKAALATTIIKQLGGVVHLPASVMDASTVVCGSTPAFIALFLDGLIDGAVAAGVPRNKADAMIAQVLGSTAALLSDGRRASTLRESVCPMPGCTIQGNIVLEEGGVRGTAAKTMKMAIEAAKKLS